MAKLGANAAIAIGLKLIADGDHSRHDLPIIDVYRMSTRSMGGPRRTLPPPSPVWPVTVREGARLLQGGVSDAVS
jgi:hypothetical protein